jgi:hypothetical protein
MRFFQLGETADSKFIFLDSTQQPVDVTSPQYTIVYYDGATEVPVVALSTLTHVTGKTGEYVCSWTIPTTIPINETYFVIATGVRPDHTNAKQEDFYRVLSKDFFGGIGMTVKFTKS